MRLSDHFELWEFSCHDGAAVPAAFVPNVQKLVREILEPVRLVMGYPVTIISGYRTREHNKKVGGAKASTHLDGSGADIRCGNPRDLHERILEMYLSGNLPALGGLGLYPGWVHVDWRRPADGHLRRWTGGRTGSEK